MKTLVVTILALIAITAGYLVLKNDGDNIETKSFVETPSPATSKVLDLSNRGLTEFPKEILKQRDLQELNLSNNSLTGALPAEIKDLRYLRILNISNNDMTGLPAELGQLRYLEVLNASDNKLTGLPYELGNLKNLKILNLKGNAYSEQDLAGIKKDLPQSVQYILD